jgi:inhibitor of cysteine peptidase
VATLDLTGAAAPSAETSVAVAPGDELAVRLDETPSTGHRWVVEQAPEGVELVGDEWTAVGSAPDARAGDPGVRELRFLAQEPVAGELVLRLRRPWLDASADDPTATIVLRPAV